MPASEHGIAILHRGDGAHRVGTTKVILGRLRALARAEMERLADEGIYPEDYDEQSYGGLKRWEKAVRPDMLFCGAPRILIPHAPLGHGEPVQDVIIAGTYFELLCASRGLGAVMMTFPLDVLALMPDVRALPGLPEDHYVGMIAGFGYPQIPYARTTQRRIDEGHIHRLSPDWSNLPIALPGRS